MQKTLSWHKSTCVRWSIVTSATKEMLDANLHRFHIKDFGDPSLHDQKVRIVHVQLNRSKQIVNAIVGCIASIDEVLVTVADGNLPKNNNHNVRRNKRQSKTNTGVQSGHSKIITNIPVGMSFLKKQSEIRANKIFQLPVGCNLQWMGKRT